MIEFKQMSREGVPVIQAKDIDRKFVSLKADVVIVGSGAGGSVMAYELAKAGKKVIVLEAGPYVPSKDFKEDMMDSMKRLYQDTGLQTNTTGDVVMLQGRCVGGSTVINATMAFRTPDAVLKQWGENHGLTNLAPDKLAPYFEKVEKRLGVHVNQPHEINETAVKVIQGCREMGWSWKPLARNVKQCALTGLCLAGCPSDRKLSMLVTYLPWAVAEGATIYSDTYVDLVNVKNGRASGVEGQIIDPVTKAVVAEIQVDAQVVVLAAGAVQTPIILQKSDIGYRSGHLGRNLSVHPAVTVLAKFPEPVYGWRGALTGVHVDEFLAPSKGGISMVSGLTAPVQLIAQGEQGTGSDHVRFMQEYKYFSALNVFVHDSGNGYVQWTGPVRGGDKKIEWNLSRDDFKTFQQAIGHAARIFFAAGAEKVYMPSFQRLIATSVFDLDKTIAAIDYGTVGLYSLRMLSYDPQGTCRMGADPFDSVVDPYGEVHDVRGLFVADASIFPTELTVNPQMSVYAMASYIADNILKRAGNFFWV